MYASIAKANSNEFMRKQQSTHAAYYLTRLFYDLPLTSWDRMTIMPILSIQNRFMLHVMQQYHFHRLFALILFTLAPQCSQAVDWYVNLNARGANNGGPGNEAWQSFAAIDQTLSSPGDRIYVADGEYDEFFDVSTSGNAPTTEGRIWYIGLAGQPRLKGVRNYSGQDYIAFVNFEFYHGDNTINQYAIRLGNNQNTTHGWLIQDCYIHNIDGGAILLRGSGNNQFNIFRGNVLQDLGLDDTDDGLAFEIQGQYNLAEYNIIGRGTDRFRVFGTFNIVRNNATTPIEEADVLGDSDPHVDFIQTYEISGKVEWTGKNLIAANYDYHNNLKHSYAWIMQDNVNVSDLKGVINRLNIHYSLGSVVDSNSLLCVFCKELLHSSRRNIF